MGNRDCSLNASERNVFVGEPHKNIRLGSFSVKGRKKFSSLNEYWNEACYFFYQRPKVLGRAFLNNTRVGACELSARPENGAVFSIVKRPSLMLSQFDDVKDSNMGNRKEEHLYIKLYRPDSGKLRTP